MTLSAVIAALNASIVNGTIDLYTAATTQPALAPLVPVLARFTIATSYALTAAKVTAGSTSATLVGSGTWGIAGAAPANIVPVSARLDCVGSSDVTFTLTLTVTLPGWTFGTSFPVLPQGQAYDPNGSVMPVPSFLSDIRLDGASFAGSSNEASSAPLTLSGSLPLTDFWTRWSHLVAPWPLQLRGTCRVPASVVLPPALDLLATTPSATLPLTNALLDLGPLALEALGFNLIVNYGPDPEDPGVDAWSELDLTGRLRVGGLVARLSCPILATGRVWHFIVIFDNGDVVEGMQQLAKLFGLPDLPTPPNYLPIPSFRFDSVEFYVEPNDDSLLGFTVVGIGAAIVSTRPWTAPVPFVTIEQCGTSWVWNSTPIDGTMTGVLAGNVFGTLRFGTGESSFDIGAAVQLPGWVVGADLAEGDVIPISTAFRNYFGDGGPPTPADMNVVALGIEADPAEQSYYASADIIFGEPDQDPFDPPVDEAQGWEIDLVVTTITLRSLSFHVDMVGGVLAGGIGGTFLLGESSDEAAPLVTVAAEYPGPAEQNPEGWTFSGSLMPGSTIGLRYMVGRYLGQNSVPDWVPDLSIDRLYFSCNTSSPIGYTFGGTISGRWNPTIFGTTLKISAAASTDMTKAPESDTPSGNLAGLFMVNKLALAASMTLGVPEPTYTFQVRFDEVWFKAYTSWRGEAEARHQVISMQLGGVTVGSMLEYFVNLAAPTIGYSLDPPWNILNQIELSRFTLTIDPEESSVELVYAANADLVFMQLDTVGIRYTRGQNGGVSLILTGSMLGQRFDGNDLEWDVVNESPPPLPGADSSFIELRYLGLGQRIQLTQLPDTVAATLALLENELKEPQPGQNPLAGQGVEWSPVSQWLIGLDIGLIDTIDLGFIFNDPWLYGLSIALGGEQAGSLSGLRFEILYKKISDNIGMFRIELTLPEAFRHFEFGEVSVTLGVVVVEIYTNGNFKIDLGFPYNRNFDRSFSVEIFPFLGRGGIYFGLLNGTTSRRVPRITNGNFAPVIELGVGLAVGVGKDISIGPLSGGIYVQVEVIFEGVVGWFHPSASGSATAVYYWAQGVAAIHGKLYGKVDFKVIKVSVTLEAYAAATVTLEAYKSTVFKLEVAVRAEASVKILFIKVHFSFKVELDTSFTVGRSRATPWILSPDQSGVQLNASRSRALAQGVDTPERQRARANSRGSARRRMQPPRRRPEQRRAVLLGEHLRRLGARGTSASEPIWQPTKTVFEDSPRTAHLFMLPSFNLGAVPLAWSSTAPANPTPQYRFAMQLFAPSGAPPEARNVQQAKQRSAAFGVHARGGEDFDALATDILVQGLLLYAIYAIPDGPEAPEDSVTAGQLEWLATMLDDPAIASAGFTAEMLGEFYSTNIHLDISGQPDGETPANQSSMAMAMPPFLSWASTQTGAVNFAADNQIGPLYLWGVQAQAARFSPDAIDPGPPPADPLDSYIAFASHLFSDWNLLIAKSGVREALAVLDNRLLDAATADDTLASIAGNLPTATVTYPVRPDDTVETVADTLGATVDEIEFLNEDFAARLAATAAGGTIEVVLGVAPQILAQDNAATVLAKTDLALGDLTVPVTSGDSFASLATRYRSSAAAILGLAGQDVDAKLLAANTSFDAAAVTWTAAPAGCTALLAAAIFFTRYAGVPVGLDAGAEQSAWYTQAVALLSKDVLGETALDPRTLELPPGVSLTIPTGYLDATAAAIPYVTVPGDTLARIGATLFVAQNPNDTGNTAWPAFSVGVTAVDGGFAIPAWSGVLVAPGETPDTLARRLVVYWVSDAGVWSADWDGLAATLGSAAILAPLTLVTVPNVVTETGASYSFASLGAAYGLSVADVGGRLASVSGLVEGTQLLVRHLPADTVESLVARVAANATAGIAGEASRFLFSGQEIPLPVAGEGGHVSASTTQVSPLFDQSRQQWNLTIDGEDPDGVALSLDVTAQTAWITLLDSSTIDGTRTAAPAALNRALATGRSLPPGAVVLDAETDTLSFSYTNQQVQDAVPATGLAWNPQNGPAAIEIKGEAPVTYGLAQLVPLQTAITLPVPGFDINQNTLSVHPFPATLAVRAQAASATPYIVYASATDTAVRAQVDKCTFATLISFTVRRIAEAPGVYQLGGAAIEQMSLLLELVSYLADPDTPAGTVAKVTLPPPVAAADPSGIAVIDGNAWLIKSNLSTETVAPDALAARGGPTGDDTTPPCFADLTDPAAFALLLWEGSSVGGIGYSFGVEGGLSDGAFDASDQATLELLVIVGAQQAVAPEGRTLLAFNTSLIAVDQGIAEGATLFAQAGPTSDATEFTTQALVPAGSTGFVLTLTRPETDTGEDGLREQFSLLTATATASADCPYTILASGLPGSPQASDGIKTPMWQRVAARQLGATDDPEPQPYWDYQSVLPIYRFGPASAAPLVAGLPAPAEDPYRGLGTAATAPQVDFSLGFGDVLGNRTASGDDYALHVPVGYSDTLNGPTTWPAVSSYYGIAGSGATITLSVTLAAKAQALMPSTRQRGDAMVEAAGRQRDQYATIYYQYVQPGMTVSIETTLQTGASPAVNGTAGFVAFAGGAYATAAGATLYGAVTAGGATLGQIFADYGASWDALAEVNAATPVAAIFGANVAVTMPAYAIMASGDTATSIAAAPRPGWPSATADEILTFSQNADDLPLRIGAVLRFPAVAVTLPEAPVLGAVATAQLTTAGWLATDSAADPILVAAFPFTIDGVTVAVGDPIDPDDQNAGTVETFAGVVLAFEARGVHIGTYQIGESYADATDMLIASATAHSAHYLVSGEATLADNPSGIDSATLAGANVATADLYEPGALIYLGVFGTGTPATITPDEADTVATLAARYGCPATAFLYANATRAVIGASALAIPGAVNLPASTDLSVPYSQRGTDTLSGIAGNFDLEGNDKATTLATRNGAMPGTVAQGQTFDVDVGGTGVPIDTTGLPSFDAVLNEVRQTAPDATMADVAAAFDVPGRLAASGLLLAPPALLAAAVSPDGIPVLYGIDGAAFGLANAGVLGLLVSGVTLAAPLPAIASQTITPHDTLNSLVGRFNDAYLKAGFQATVTVDALIEANLDVVMFAEGARALLPPADVIISRDLSHDGPYPGAAFALDVVLDVARPPALMLAGFETGSAASASATIAAPARSAVPGSSMTFDAFEAALTAALPNLRLATAKTDDRTADLWAVDFGTAGITSVALTKGVTYGEEQLARMIALAPLYRELVTRREVPIAPLIGGHLDSDAAVNHDYQGIDVQIWATRFLGDFDRMLSPAYASAINTNAVLRDQFVRLMQAKATLQIAVPEDLAAVFRVNPEGSDLPRAVTDPNLVAGLTTARAALGQALGISLSSAWATAAIVQYDGSVDSAWTRSPDPEGDAALQGEARSNEQSDLGTPPWRLASGKVSLADTAPFLTLPMAVSDPAAQSHIALDLAYAVSNLEIHRLPVETAPGYTSSDWLAMAPVLIGDDVPAALSLDLGATDVPIPLRAFPALPQIVNQEAAADPVEPVTLTTASLWSFDVVYAHEHAAQDHVALTVQFNLTPPRELRLSLAEPQDLFTALAQYVAVADDLNDLLAALVDPARTVPPDELGAAVTTFADLAIATADLWPTRLPNNGAEEASGDGWIPGEVGLFSAVVSTVPETQRQLLAYALTRTEGTVGWPNVACQAADGGWVALVAGAVDGDTCTYAPPGGTELLLTSWPHFALSWPGLNVSSTQNTRIAIEVVRNTDLLGASGPATADAFVYRTATVTAPEIATPALTRNDPLEMSGPTIEEALQAAFDTLFPPKTRRDDLKLTLGLYYGYELTPGIDGLVSELAVGLVPDQTLTEDTAAMVAAALDAWQTAVKPNANGGLWIIALMLYSSLDPGKRVLLSINRLSYSLA
ncbi:hypothetical protein [Sphingomonas sp.]|jgi:hypothetical protein|uniref:hypothetical protein n=1 Tax=Sphingomonas sp. TaxID=28214 RepID=UPI0035613ABB